MEESDGNDKVTVGCKVTVQEEDLSPETFFLVGSQEADPGSNKISHIPPIGKALLAQRVGDSVNIKTPGGEFVLKILAIE